MDHDDMADPVAKKRQARRGGSKNDGKFSMPDGRRVEKTRVRINIMASGLSRDHRKPRMEPLYLSLNSLIVRFHTSSRYSSNL